MKLVDGFYYPENVVQAAVFVGKEIEKCTCGAWYKFVLEEYRISAAYGREDWYRYPLSVVAEVCAEGPEYDIVIGYDAMGIAQTQTVNATGFMLANYDYDDYRTLMEAFSET